MTLCINSFIKSSPSPPLLLSTSPSPVSFQNNLTKRFVNTMNYQNASLNFQLQKECCLLNEFLGNSFHPSSKIDAWKHTIRPMRKRVRTCESLLFRKSFKYSKNLSDANVAQLNLLWQRSLKEFRNPKKILIALRNSFSLIFVIDEDALNDDGTKGRIIGFGRAICDGAFIATICDVCVDCKYRHKGIGRKIIKELMRDMKSRGITAFGVFPPPIARRFFWNIGFRSEQGYRIMGYRTMAKLSGPKSMQLFFATENFRASFPDLTVPEPDLALKLPDPNLNLETFEPGLVEHRPCVETESDKEMNSFKI